MATAYVSVKVEVDMSEFSDDDILDEAAERGIIAGGGGDDSVTEMFYAFKQGRNDRAMEIARHIAQEHTGMIL